MNRGPPIATRTSTLIPYTTLFRAYRVVKLAARLAGGEACGLCLEKPFGIVALALKLRDRGFRDCILHPCAARRRDRIDLFDGEFRFLVHPNILRVRSIPRMSAAMSSSSL